MPRGLNAQTAIVTGATGQDGYFLVRRLLDDGWRVWAAVRDVEAAEEVFQHHPNLTAVRRDLLDPGPLCALIGDVRPEELYNLAGESSVGASFDDPRRTWNSNAHAVVHLLDAIRGDSPQTRVYQASSGEMFGSPAGGSAVHDESSPLNPQSPYAAAKAAAHLLCRSYRESYASGSPAASSSTTRPPVVARSSSREKSSTTSLTSDGRMSARSSGSAT